MVDFELIEKILGFIELIEKNIFFVLNLLLFKIGYRFIGLIVSW